MPKVRSSALSISAVVSVATVALAQVPPTPSTPPPSPPRASSTAADMADWLRTLPSTGDQLATLRSIEGEGVARSRRAPGVALLLAADTAEVRVAAAQALIAIRPDLKTQGPRLTRLVRRPPPPRPDPITICEFHEFVSRATLTTRLSDPQPEVRINALDQCCRSRFRDGALITAMKALLADDEPEVRAAAATAIPQVAWSEDVCTQLLHILADDEAVVRAGAVRGLAHGGSPAAIDGVRDALGDENPLVRVAAIHRMGARSQANLAPEAGLALALRDPVARVRVAALHAVARRKQDDNLTVTELLTRLESLASNPVGLPEATELRRTLGTIRTLRGAAQSCWPLTLALTNHDNPLVRATAMGTAPLITEGWSVNRGTAILRLVEGLTDPSGAVRATAADHLAHCVPRGPQ